MENKSLEKSEVHTRKLGAGSPRGRRAKETIGSPFYGKGDEYSLSGYRFQADSRVLHSGLAPPSHWAGKFFGCILFSFELSWHWGVVIFTLSMRVYLIMNEFWGGIWVNFSQLESASFGQSVNYTFSPHIPQEQLIRNM